MTEQVVVDKDDVAGGQGFHLGDHFRDGTEAEMISPELGDRAVVAVMGATPGRLHDVVKGIGAFFQQIQAGYRQSP